MLHCSVVSDALNVNFLESLVYYIILSIFIYHSVGLSEIGQQDTVKFLYGDGDPYV